MRLEALRLVKRFDDTFTLSVPELCIAAGETVGLVGNNGAGKTTFLRLVLDLLPADEGGVWIGEEPVHESAAWKSHTASFLDASFLIDFLTPDEFLSFVGSTYGIDQDEVKRRLDAYRSFFSDEVFEQTTRRIRDLSTGNAKKVGLVSALITQPRLLILDEPFANLDPRSQLKLRKLLSEENEARGTTMLISSHDLLHVTDVCRRITVLEDGEIVRDEPTTPATLRSLEAYFAEPEDLPAPSNQP